MVLVSIILISYAARYTTLPFGPIGEGVAQPDTIELFDYVKRQTAEDAVFIFVKPRVLSLFTNRQAAVYHWTQGETGLLRFMEEIHADYAVTTQVFGRDREFFQPFLERHPRAFREVYANPTFRVYRFTASP